MKFSGLHLKPYVMGQRRMCAPMLDRCPLPDPLLVDIHDPASIDFYRLVNAANRRVYGDLGMPAWVQLDCATLPSAMIGFAAHRDALKDDTWRALTQSVRAHFGDNAARRLHAYQGWVPISEYCAAATFEAHTVVGFSFFTLIKGLGVRTKALALTCYGAHRQIGVTQYTNPSITAHCAFGPLDVIEPRTAAHSRPDETFTYELRLGDTASLTRLILRGADPTPPPLTHTLTVPISPSSTAVEVEALMRRHGPLQIVSPGVLRGHTPASLTLRPTPTI